MTKSTAIICETNPCHRGHRYLFDQVRGENGVFLQNENTNPTDTTDVVIAVMSGNFVQRGLPAVLDKYTRAEILLTQGADLVAELPYPWCAAGGEAFAAGGVAVAAGLGADRLAFGSESGDGTMLTRCAAWLDSHETRARMLALEEAEPDLGAAVLHERLCAEGGFTLKPNDKLAVWYLRQIAAQRCGMVPCPIRRLPHDAQVISATKIREKLALGEDIAAHVPEDLAERYRGAAFTDSGKFYDLAFTYLRLRSGFPMGEDKSGLLARLTDAAYHSTGGAELLEQAATKKYTHARIRRTALLAMTDCPAPDSIGLPKYTVLLAANGRGRAYLNERRKTADFPILTKPAHGWDLPEDARTQFAWLSRADSLYAMLQDKPGDAFLREHPRIL